MTMNGLINSNSDQVEDKNPPSNDSRFDLTYFPQTDVLANTLNKIFPEQTHESKLVQRAKEILGDKYSTEEVKSMVASFEYLVNNWLGDFEKKVFDGKTLKELVQGL